MPTVAVVGAQWGDEGKGKIVDALAAEAEVVVRYQGGNNAGHTVMVGDRTFKLRLIPSGILYPGTLCVIGNGAVVNPLVLLQEIDGLQAQGVDTGGLRLSERAHVIMPYHEILDRLEEGARGSRAIGTTGLGIGPCYVDKAARLGLRLAELVDPDVFRARLEDIVPLKNRMLECLYGHRPLTVDEIVEAYAPAAERLRPLVTDTSALVRQAIADGRRVLFEGAQGTLLDVDHGTYPYVTSSSPAAGGIASGAGVSPRSIEKVLGVVKAYITRVGGGPFPTELMGEDGEILRREGHEFGTVTGRPRRCGWFDAVAGRYAAQLNGLTDLAVLKLDVLSHFDEVKIAVGYRIDGELVDRLPARLDVLANAEPVWETLPGWRQDLTGIREWDRLPRAAQQYVRRIEELMEVPVAIVSVGPRRDETIQLRPLF